MTKVALDPETRIPNGAQIFPSRCKKIPSATGFEPVRAEPKRFQVSLLNHSDKLTVTVCFSFQAYLRAVQKYKFFAFSCSFAGFLVFVSFCLSFTLCTIEHIMPRFVCRKVFDKKVRYQYMKHYHGGIFLELFKIIAI